MMLLVAFHQYMVYANKICKFKSISFDSDFEKSNLVDWVTDIKYGASVHKFRDAQDCIGEFILRYDNMEQMFEVIRDMGKYIHIEIE